MNYAANDHIFKAILGPTNTGKTHYAVERMLGRQSGVIGLPLRLLAREVYDRICAIKGPAQCALVTGEEKIVPDKARYFVCTVEAMPVSTKFAFAAIDEIQLMNHPERGHVFTDRVLNYRGTEETLLLGAETARPLIEQLLPSVRHETRERFSTLSYSGAKKLSRLPKRSVVVAFSTDEVYALAELLRRLRGGAAIVMGNLSPRTRNAQAELFQSGDVDFLVATDAIGMGLNLDTDHVAFASIRKFDGRHTRRLTPMEVGQIAGRAGRFRNHGTFGPTGDCPPFDEDLVSRIEHHDFEPLAYAEWRNRDLDYRSIDALQNSLSLPPPQKGLRRIAPATDELTLEHFISQTGYDTDAVNPDLTQLIWEVCQIPDFRNLSLDNHYRIVLEIYEQLISGDKIISNDFMERKIARIDHVDGGVDILSTRLAQIRTWTYCANKSQWLKDSTYWVQKTREVENRLSDALHERLTARFVDRRTRFLLRGVNLGYHMDASIKDNGEVWVGEHKIGQITGLSFQTDDTQSELEAKAVQQAAEQIVKPEINRRLTSIGGGTHSIFTLDDKGRILWGGVAVGRIAPSGTVFNPSAELIGGELADPPLYNLGKERLEDFLRSESNTKLAPLSALKDLSNNPEMPAETRGVAFQLLENYGHLDRKTQGKDVSKLAQNNRKSLRDAGVVFGQYDVYMHELIKPKPAKLLSLLTAYGAGGDGKPFIPFAGVTSIANEGDFNSDNFSPQAIAYAGYKALGPRIIRFDILNRLAAMIRQAQRESGTRRFRIMQEMLALLGCTYEEARGVLSALGYQSEILPDDSAQDVRPELAAPVPTRFVDSNPPAQTSEPSKDEEGTTPPSSPAETASESLANTDAAPTPSPEAANGAPEKAQDKDATHQKVESQESVPIHSAKKAQPKDRTLKVYNFRETAEDGTVTEVENREFWFMPFRSANARPDKPGQRTSYRKKDKTKKAPPQNSKKKPARQNSSYKDREAKNMADSPFAVLADMKNNLKNGGKNGS